MAKEHSHLEIISDGEDQLAYIIRADWLPKQTEFLTPDHFGQQMGMIVYGEGKSITPHVHLPVVREVHGTSEVILVRKGSCEIDIYSAKKKFLTKRHLGTGDIVLLLKGGHGFKMVEDTVLFEVKQGPFVDGADKERF